jgi:competence protein ComEC
LPSSLYLKLSLLLSLLLSSCAKRANLPLTIYFIDVGHGDCILIRTPDDGIKNNLKNEGLKILIDGGELAPGKKILLPFLRYLRIDTIDCLIATHFHSDHIGGLIPVLESLAVKTVLTNCQSQKGELNERFLQLVKQEKALWRIARAPDTLFWGKELSVFILNPETLERDENNNSIVLKIEYGGKGILLCGDIEGKERNEAPEKIRFKEKRLVEKYRNLLPSFFLKVAHHGSETSSTEPFLTAVSPKVAIITAGRKRFGNTILPDSSVVLRLEGFGAKIFRTDFADTSYRTAFGDDHIYLKILPNGEFTVGYLPPDLIPKEALP